MSRALGLMIGEKVRGTSRTIILHMWMGDAVTEARGNYYSLTCFGRKAHYRSDGSCIHTVSLLEHMKPWYRSRTRLTPFGGKS